MKTLYRNSLLLLGFFSYICAIVLCSGSDSNFDFNGFPYINETTPSGNFHLKETNLTKGVYRWLIEPKSKTFSVFHVNLFFESLFLHENDRVTIFKSINDSTDDTKSLITPLQAQNGSVTIMTDLSSLVVKLTGNDTSYIRKFECYYSSVTCDFSIPPALKIIHSPIYIGKNTSVDCKYTYNYDPKKRQKPVFQFDTYNYAKSSVELESTTYPQPMYNAKIPMDFFPLDGHSSMHITVHVKDVNESFCLLVHQVDSSCSQYILLNKDYPMPIFSPKYMLDNGSFGDECLWVVQHSEGNKILGVAFEKLHLSSVLDIISINDGASYRSPPLYQVTTSQTNVSMNQLIRSSGPYLWIAFKPVSFISEILANITVHGQGGHHTGSGSISMVPTPGNDTAFMLDVNDGEVVMLDFTNSDFKPPATVTVYDGFDKSNVITTLHGNVTYPILSQSSKMTLIATSFNEGKFTANFKGVSPGCMHMSTLTNENYVLSGNCNSTCMWIIPPQNVPGSTLLLHIQYISLTDKDTAEIVKLDAARTPIGTLDSSLTHVPTMSIPASVGALVQITRKECSKPDDVVLIGHSSFIPACGGKLELKGAEFFHVSSPLFPDTYPLFSNCNWTISSPKNSLVHLTFDSLSLAPEHCIRVFDILDKTSFEYSGSDLPDDLFVSNGSVVEFISDKCKESKTSLKLVSSEGFKLNGTVAECGSVLDKNPSGSLSVNVSASNQTLCIWKVWVPSSNSAVEGSVNVIAYKIAANDEKGNYEMKVFDGATVREPQIVNTSASEIWSRKNSIIIVYKRLNASLPSTVFNITYKTITCNSTSLCDNKLCMHPDWVCNGMNDCGDYSDEKNCDVLPPPPIIQQFGYSATTFWVTLFCMLGTGVLFGIGGKVFYEKYKNGQYHRFSDISVIE